MICIRFRLSAWYDLIRYGRYYAYLKFLCWADLYNEVELKCVLCKFWEHCSWLLIYPCRGKWKGKSFFCYCVSNIPLAQFYFMNSSKKIPPRVFLLKEILKFDQIHCIYLNNKLLDYCKKLRIAFFGTYEASGSVRMPCITLWKGCSLWLSLVAQSIPL